MRSAYGWLVAAAVFAFARTSEAAPPARARLTYERPAACPDEATLRAAVVKRMGEDPFDDDAALSVRAEVTTTARGFHAVVRLVGPDEAVRGTRELDDLRCEDVVATMALSISIALSPENIAEPPPSAIPKPPRAASPSAPPTDPSPGAPPPVAQESTHFEVAAGTAVWVGAAPAANLAFSAAVAARWRRLSVDFGGRLDLPAARRVPGGTVETSLTLVEVIPCVHVSLAALCGVAAIGQIRAESRDVAQPAEDDGVHAATGARLAVELPLTGALVLAGHATGLVALTTDALALDGNEVYTLPRASFGFGIGARLRFF